MASLFQIDTSEFDGTFKEYMKVSSRELEKAVNTKAYFIARRAMRETPKPERQKIYDEMDKQITAVSRHGRSIGKSGVVDRKYAQAQRWLTKKRGTTPYFRQRRAAYARQLKDAVRKIVGQKVRSAGFMKAGWIPAIQALAPVSDPGGAPSMGLKPKPYGKPKGRAIITRAGSLSSATIINSTATGGKREAKHQVALKKHGEPALQRAINAETASMLEYMNKKLHRAARQMGITANL